jgi:hypothetical protein
MTLYAPRIRIHQVLARGKAATVTLPIYRDGGLVVPASGTYNLVDESGVDVIAASAVSISGSIATYNISAPQLPDTLNLSEGYMEHWALVIGGDTFNFKRPCAIARSYLYPVISDLDLEAQYSDLASLKPASMTSYQTYIDEAWYQIILRLRELGNLEYLIMDPQALRMSHINLSCYLIFKDFDSSGLGEGRYLDLAKHHREAFSDCFKRQNWRYDLDSNDQMDDPNKRRAGQSVIYTCTPPPYWSRF